MVVYAMSRLLCCSRVMMACMSYYRDGLSRSPVASLGHMSATAKASIIPVLLRACHQVRYKEA